MVRTRQGGSILEFIIIGSVMAVLLVGGAYFVRKNLMPSSQNEESTSQDNTDDELIRFTEEESSEAENSDSQPPQDENTSALEQVNDDQIPQTGQESQAPEQLPETGPADSLLTGFLLSGIVAAAAAYKRSRSASASL